MRKIGILYDNISGNTGDVAIGLSLKKILRLLNIKFDELIPGNFNPLEYETIIVGGGYLLRESPDFFYDKFRVPGNHILNAMGIYGEPKDLEYLKSYKFITVRSNGDKKKLAYLNQEIHVIPCTTMLLEDVPDIPLTIKKPSIGIHIFPILLKDEEKEFIDWVSSLPFFVYFVPITHYNKDIQYMRDLHEKIPNSEVLPILKAQEIFTICGEFDYFISCSLHGAIFSYVHNVPFILFNSQDKMQFFMEDRQLDHYLFKNFKELKQGFEELLTSKIDYSKKIIEDKKILTDYVNYLSSVLPVNETQQGKNNVNSFESTYQIAYLLSDISELERTNAKYKTQISDMVTYTNNIERAISDRDNQIAELKIYSASLQTHISDRDNQIASLQTHISDRDNQIASLQTHISDCDNQIAEVTPYARHLEQEISAKNRYIIDITDLHYTLKIENNSLKQSITYQLTKRFHDRIIQRVFPQNSRRRQVYDRGIELGRFVLNNGWMEGIKSVKKYRADKKHPDMNVNQTEIESNISGGKKDSPLNPSIADLNEKLQFFLSESCSRLIFPHYSKPMVSIIILTFNKSPYTFQCLQSILKNTDVPYELIIVDNGSTDSTSELLTRIDHCIIIKNINNIGFIKGCNEGAKKASSKYLLFLNNDTVVTENWLNNLVRTIEKDPKCGAVGCKLVWPNGQLQEAGSIIWKDGSASGYGRGEDPLKPEYSYYREIDFCSGACLLVRTDLFEKLKGFDERYIPAYYEDADLCLGIQNLGYKVIYQPTVTIFHHEFTSSSKESATKYMIQNQTKFIEKWQGQIISKKINKLDTILDARDIRKGKKVLVIDDRIPASNQGSGYPRANVLLMNLGELGFKVTFFPFANKTPWQPYTSQFQSLGIEVLFGEHLDFEEFSQKRSDFYDMIIVSRPHNFERTYPIIKRYFRHAYLIYDAEALFSTREILKAKIEGVKLEDNQIQKLRANEFELMKKADMIITVSENEKEIIQKTGGLENIIIFGHPIPVKKSVAGFIARKDILFVGSFLASNGPNDDAILYFVREIWPSIQRQLNCKLYIVGINPPDVVKILASESIIVTGFVQNIEEYYNQCRVFIVPHRYAAGIPLKLIEAMSKGIPAVVSEIIAVQLRLTDGQEVFIAKNSSEFAEKIIQLYQNESLWERLQQKSIEYVQMNNNPETIKKYLEKAINFSGDN